MKIVRLLLVLLLTVLLPSCGEDTPSGPGNPGPTGPTQPAGVNLSVTVVNANTTTNMSDPPYPIISWEICLQYAVTLDGAPAAGIDLAPLETRGMRPNGNTVLLDVVDPPPLDPGGSFATTECSEFDQNANIGANGVVNQVQVTATGTDQLGNAFNDQVIVDVVNDDLENLGQGTCQPNNTTLCLGDNLRFRVNVVFGDGTAPPAPANVNFPGFQAYDDIGSFWFFNSDDEDLVIQILNRCNDPAFNSFWVFAAGSTNVEVEMTVTDTASGQLRTYKNPLSTPFQPIQDTSAFATCPSPAPLPAPED